MAVPVEADLMALLGDLLALVRKRFERVTGDEERCLDIVLVKSFSIRWTPTVPAKRPRDMSDVESSPPYEPSQPATASMSTEIHACTFFFAIVENLISASLQV